jgi:polysaccharide export outer membrane protein
VASDFIIGPEDMLQISIWKNESMSRTLPVRPDGKISTPLVEDMVAVGKSPAQLARDVEKVLSEYVRSPTVNVIVATAASALSQIKVIGQVKVPQSVPYRDGLRVLDVILLAGGVTDFAAPNRAKVVRAAVNNGKPKEERVKLGDLMEKGDMKQNLLLGPGDALVVPQARF